MAGTKHHILPRFLLKGFASRIEDTKVFTWVYRRDGKNFEASTKDVSVEKYFYGKENNLSVDTEITDLETNFQLMPLLPYLISEYMEQKKSEVLMFSHIFFLQAIKNLPKVLQDSHIKALSNGLIPESRLEIYRSLKWFICYSQTPLILGDMGCLFETSGRKRYKFLNDENDEIINVFLPISSFQILLGTILSSPPQIDYQVIKDAYARCSREYFICSKPSPEMASMSLNIGVDAEIISKDELKQILEF